MVPKHKMCNETDNIVLILLVVKIQCRQEFYLRFCLHQERFLALDDFDCHISISLFIDCPNHLPKRTFAYAFLDNVTLVEQLPRAQDVIVILVVKPIIVHSKATFNLLSSRNGPGLSARISLLVINLIYSFVRINKRYG